MAKLHQHLAPRTEKSDAPLVLDTLGKKRKCQSMMSTLLLSDSRPIKAFACSSIPVPLKKIVSFYPQTNTIFENE